jgi:hypothetical protein
LGIKNVKSHVLYVFKERIVYASSCDFFAEELAGKVSSRILSRVQLKKSYE